MENNQEILWFEEFSVGLETSGAWMSFVKVYEDIQDVIDLKIFFVIKNLGLDSGPDSDWLRIQQQQISVSLSGFSEPR